MKRAILILGPPRSGTSVVSQVLSKLGVDFGDPDRFLDPETHTHNPIFFELKSLNDLNDRVLRLFSKNYENFDYLPLESDFSNECIRELSAAIPEFLESELSGSTTIGLKDPRFCFTLPFWERALTQNGFKVQYVHTQRRSNSVYNSNRSINGLSDEVNHRLVAQSYLAARHFTSSKACIEISYEALLQDPEEVIKELCQSLDLNEKYLPEALSVVSRSLNHHGQSNDHEPVDNFFCRVIDEHHGSTREYLYYREIFLASNCERGRTLAEIVSALDDEAALGLERLAQVEALTKSVTDLQESLDTKNSLLDDILSSHSWKLTRPLRFLKKLLK